MKSICPRKYSLELKIVFEKEKEDNIDEGELLKTLVSDINVAIENSGFNFIENLYNIKLTSLRLVASGYK